MKEIGEQRDWRTFPEALDKLRSGYGVAIGIKFRANGMAAGGHNVTLWGYILDESREGRERYTALLMSDSDTDETGIRDRRSAPDRLSLYMMEPFDEDGFNAFQLSGYPECQTILAECNILAPFSEETERETEGSRDRFRDPDLKFSMYDPYSFNTLSKQGEPDLLVLPPGETLYFAPYFENRSAVDFTGDSLSYAIRILNEEGEELYAGSNDVNMTEPFPAYAAQGVEAGEGLVIEGRLPEGDYTLELILDPENVIREASKTNNRITRRIFVRPPVDAKDAAIKLIPKGITEDGKSIMGIEYSGSLPEDVNSSFSVSFYKDGEWGAFKGFGDHLKELPEGFLLEEKEGIIRAAVTLFPRDEDRSPAVLYSEPVKINSVYIPESVAEISAEEPMTLHVKNGEEEYFSFMPEEDGAFYLHALKPTPGDVPLSCLEDDSFREIKPGEPLSMKAGVRCYFRALPKTLPNGEGDLTVMLSKTCIEDFDIRELTKLYEGSFQPSIILPVKAVSPYPSLTLGIVRKAYCPAVIDGQEIVHTDPEKTILKTLQGTPAPDGAGYIYDHEFKVPASFGMVYGLQAFLKHPSGAKIYTNGRYHVFDNPDALPLILNGETTLPEGETEGLFSFKPEAGSWYELEAKGASGTLSFWDGKELSWRAASFDEEHSAKHFLHPLLSKPCYFHVDNKGALSGNRAVTLKLTKVVPEVTAFEITDNAPKPGTYATKLSLSANMPFGSSFRAGFEYGADKAVGAASTNRVTKTFMEEPSEELTLTLTVPTEPGTAYKYRTVLYDMEKTTFTYGEWRTFETPAAKEGDVKALKAYTLTQMDDETVFSFTAKEGGLHTLTATGLTGRLYLRKEGDTASMVREITADGPAASFTLNAGETVYLNGEGLQQVIVTKGYASFKEDEEGQPELDFIPEAVGRYLGALYDGYGRLLSCKLYEAEDKDSGLISFDKNENAAYAVVYRIKDREAITSFGDERYCAALPGASVPGEAPSEKYTLTGAVKGESYLFLAVKGIYGSANEALDPSGDNKDPWQALLETGVSCLEQRVAEGDTLDISYDLLPGEKATLLLLGDSETGRILSYPGESRELPYLAVDYIRPSAYTGGTIKPVPVVRDKNGIILSRNKSYSVSYKDNKKALDAAKLIIKGKGTYKKQSATVLFRILPMELKACNIELKPDFPFKSKGVDPKPVVKNGSRKLNAGRDYTVTYFKTDEFGVQPGNLDGGLNAPLKESGFYAAQICSKGDDYRGEVWEYFRISPESAKVNLSKAKVRFADNKSSCTVKYTGEEILLGKEGGDQIPLTVTIGKKVLEEGKDYYIVYPKDHTNPGKVGCQIAPAPESGEYCGVKSFYFTIK